jgi:sugar phosphate isomerase/epimerase
MSKFTLLALLTVLLMDVSAQRLVQKPEIGIAARVADNHLLKAAGYTCTVESIGRLISPLTVSEEEFEKNLKTILALETPIYAFNIFFSGDMKLVGPTVDEKAILTYVEQVMKRVNLAKVPMIVWGSSGARRVPEGFDQKVAVKQFVAIAKKVAAIAQRYNIMITLEALNSTETNFILSVKEALDIVKKVDHPNFRLNVDFYHMLKENEGPKIIAKTKKYIKHVEIAERDNRTAPGVAGTDFRPYLRELAKIGFHDKIVIEGRYENIAEVLKMSHDFLKKQIDEVYK